MSSPITAWTETESATYRSLSSYAVPERERQVDIATALVRATTAEGDALDLCCGEGLLTAALLAALPDARVLAFDGSDSMLAATAERAGAPGRLTTRRIDLADPGWRRFERPLRAVVSSLAVHHLDGPEKRALFADLHAALAPGGVFVLADVIRPATRAGDAVAAAMWDEETRRRALALDGTLAGYDAFVEADWNHFHRDAPDPLDKPSSVAEHVDWLREAGFADVDLHWMMAGQMIVSGWRR